ncbi:Calx-beta domain-containing protein [Rubripirellula tenax]|uniref:Calx-beta domain-containing protein n=1 Tax=Rubripirellula tenax TaxID=2528015 RepID=UPI0016472239|nr:Calx-beta domain-containing protein [Rubripirellula tenax]
MNRRLWNKPSRPNRRTTRKARFELLEGRRVLAAIASGQLVSDSVDTGANQTDSYTFFLAVGDSVRVSVGESASSSASPKLELLGPESFVVDSDTGSSEALIQLSNVTTAGTYTAVVSDDNNDQSLDYRIRLFVTPASTTLVGSLDGVLENDTPLSRAVSVGGFNVFQFRPVVGGPLSVAVNETPANPAPTSASPKIEVFNSAGDLIAMDIDTQTAQINIASVTTSDIYTAIVSDETNDRGFAFSIRATGIQSLNNVSPTVSDIADLTVAVGTTIDPIAFTIGDTETNPNNLTVAVTSSNTNVVPATGISLSGTGVNRQVSIVPATGQTGASTITVTVTDGAGATATDTFELTVEVPNTDPTLSDIADVAVIQGSAIDPITFTINDAETPAATLNVSFTSTNAALLPASAITLAGSGANRQMTLAPVVGQFGSTMVTVTVTDAGGKTASDTFSVTVASNNGAPTISNIANVTVPFGSPSDAIRFSVIDGETVPEALTVSFTSSNVALVPQTGFAPSGTGSNRQVVITPNAGQSGTSIITVTVTDASGFTGSDTFILTVTPENVGPTISEIADQSVEVGTTSADVNFTIADDTTATDSLGIALTSSDETFLPTANVVLSGTGAVRTLTLTPVADVLGSSVVTVTVTDADGVASVQTFTFEVVPDPNELPTISSVPDLTLFAGNSVTGIRFTIGDLRTTAAELVVTSTASDTGLIAPEGFEFSGEGATRFLSITPTGTQTGTSTITVTVTDGDGFVATETFDVTLVDSPSIGIMPATGAFVDPDDRPGLGPQPTSWQQQRSEIRELVIDFPFALSSLTIDQFTIVNRGVNADIDMDTVVTLRDDQLTLSADGRRATLAIESGQLRDGAYSLLFSGRGRGGSFTDGSPAIGDFRIDATSENGLFVLEGDWNGSGDVTNDDFATFVYWFGSQSPSAPQYVDTNGSGAVNIQDFVPFANNFGKQIAFPGTGSASNNTDGGTEMPGAINSSAVLDFLPVGIDVVEQTDGSSLAVVEGGQTVRVNASITSSELPVLGFQLNFGNSTTELGFANYDAGSDFTFAADPTLDSASGDRFVSGGATTAFSVPPTRSFGSFDVTIPTDPGFYRLTAAFTDGDETENSLLATADDQSLAITDFGDLVFQVFGDVPTLSLAESTQVVGESDGLVAFDVTLSKASVFDITVPYAVSGTATAEDDYLVPRGSIVIPAGQTRAAISIGLVNDQIAEANETLIVTIGTPIGASVAGNLIHTATIDDDDSTAVDRPTVSISPASQQVAENASSLMFNVNLSQATTVPVTVSLSYGGTAVVGEDYQAAPTSVVIPAGETTAVVMINVIDDDIFESTETLIATIGSPVNAALTGNSVYTASITDDDDDTQVIVPTVSVDPGFQTVLENVGSLSFAVTLSAVSETDVTIPFTVTGTATATDDYTAPVSPLLIPAGQTSATLSIAIVNDGMAEPDETIVVTLGEPTGATLAENRAHTATIAANDDVIVTPTATFSIAATLADQAEGDIGTTPFTFTVTRSGNTSGESTINYSVTGTTDAGADPNDFAADESGGELPSGSVMFADGETSATITVSVSGDTTVESTERFLVTIVDPLSEVPVAAGQAEGVIRDDDRVSSGVRYIRPAQVVGLHVVPGDDVTTVIMFQAMATTSVTVTPVSTASLTESIRIINRNLETISTFVGGVAEASVEAGNLYAIIIDGRTQTRTYSVRSSMGDSSLASALSNNFIEPTDTNADGETTARDALLVINELARTSTRGEAESLAGDRPISFPDVNGDQRVSARDALMVINQLARQRVQSTMSATQPTGIRFTTLMEFENDSSTDSPGTIDAGVQTGVEADKIAAFDTPSPLVPATVDVVMSTLDAAISDDVTGDGEN